MRPNRHRELVPVVYYESGVRVLPGRAERQALPHRGHAPLASALSLRSATSTGMRHGKRGKIADCQAQILIP
jgi:hypothetical protein